MSLLDNISLSTVDTHLRTTLVSLNKERMMTENPFVDNQSGAHMIFRLREVRKVTTLLRLLFQLQREKADEVDAFIDPHRKEIYRIIRRELNKPLTGRMDDCKTIIFSVFTEAFAQFLLDSVELREEFEVFLSECYPAYFKVRDSVDEYVHDINTMERALLLSKSTKIEKDYVMVGIDGIQCLLMQYIIAFKIEPFSEALPAETMTRMMSFFDIKHNDQKLIYKKYNLSMHELLADILEVDSADLYETPIFRKYKKKCGKIAAEWLEENITSKMPPECSEVPHLEDFQKAEETDYLVDSLGSSLDFINQVFLYILNRAYMFTKVDDTPEEERVILTSPLAPLLNVCTEIKWLPPGKHSEKTSLPALETALVMVVSGSAVSCFDGGDPYKDLLKTNLIRFSTPKNTESFVMNLFASYIINRIAWEFKAKDFDCFEIVEKLESKAGDKGRAAVPRPSVYKKEQKGEPVDIGQLLRIKTEEVSELYEKRISALEDKNMALWRAAQLKQDELDQEREDRENDRRQIERLKKMIESYEAEEDERNSGATQEYYTDEELINQRLLFVGGRYELIGRLKQTFPNAKFVLTETDPLPNLSKIDRIVYFHRWMNHSLYDGVFDKAKPLDMPYIFISTQNFEQVWERLKHKRHIPYKYAPGEPAANYKK